MFREKHHKIDAVDEGLGRRFSFDDGFLRG